MNLSLNNRIFIMMLILFLMPSCLNKSEYPGFSRGKHGIYYQLHKIGEDTDKALPGDFVTADITYQTMYDSVFFAGRRKLQITEPRFKGGIDDCFMMLAEKESATFIISASDFFRLTLQSDLPSFLNEDDMMKVTLDIIEIQTEEEFVKEKEAFLRWIEDFGDYEKIILKQFLDQEKLSVKPEKDGMYRIILKEGTGLQIEAGDTITINYEGKFLNGKFFDSTIKRNQPFQFVYGTEWQVIKGLEEALAMMTEGEKSLFIFPSEMAFGKEGSSTGIIPPYTSLIFEVEVLEVMKGN
ncbi:MAG TPA: FKBP-type peptidyl-prolyl cis-trans isomerase [Bacteroidales bacterium]|nr:FKBP-type peptidyl-prolyl cis-trans isomerase [Bacteroidales bacterium]